MKSHGHKETHLDGFQSHGIAGIDRAGMAASSLHGLVSRALNALSGAEPNLQGMFVVKFS